ncbi:hypothetical protein GCM10028807_04530 [Spirosoma daeguense]
MKFSEIKIAEWFLRLSLSTGFLSASADRFGLWPSALSAWGNWENFINYTKTLLPFLPSGMVTISAVATTILEMLFGIALLTNFKTSWVTKGSCALLLLFGFSMAFSVSIKAPFDYSVFTCASAAFALSVLVNRKSREV